MKRTLLGLASIALLTLSACGTPVAEAETAPATSVITDSTPTSASTTPEAPPTPHDAVPTPVLPMPFGTTVAATDGVTVRIDEPKGYDAGDTVVLGDGEQKIPAGDKPVSVIRLDLVNEAGKAFPLDSVTVYVHRDGAPVTKVPFTHKKLKGLTKQRMLPPGGRVTAEYVVVEPVDGVWDVEVTGVDDVGTEVPWARFSSDVDAWSPATEMHLKTMRPRTGAGIPLSEE